MSWEIKQRVNFYLDEFQPPKIPGDLKMILIGAGLHVGIAVVVLLAQRDHAGQLRHLPRGLLQLAQGRLEP